MSSWNVVMNRAANLTDQELGLRFKWDRTVFVTNLSYDCKWPALKDFMKENVGEVSFCDVFEENGRSSGTAAVEFKLVEDARNACRVSLKLLNRKLSVFMDEDGKRTRRAAQQAFVAKIMAGKTSLAPLSTTGGDSILRNAGSSQRGRGSSDFNSSTLASNVSLGLSHSPANHSTSNTIRRSSPLHLRARSSTRAEEFSAISADNSQTRLYSLLRRLGVEGDELSDRVIVTNLDSRITKQKLYDVFSLAGQILDISFLSAQNSSNPSAVIQFDRVVDALQAIAMLDGQYLYDRRLSIRLSGSSIRSNSPSRLPAGLSGVGERLDIEDLLLCQKNTPSSYDRINDLSGSRRKRTAESGSTSRLFDGAVIENSTGSRSSVGHHQYSSSNSRRSNDLQFTSSAFYRGHHHHGDSIRSRSQQASNDIYDDLRRRLKQPRLSGGMMSPSGGGNSSGSRSISSKHISDGLHPNNVDSPVRQSFDDSMRSYSSRMRSNLYSSLNRSDFGDHYLR